MPTDITTLAIECQTKNAISNVENFNKRMEGTNSIAGEVAKSLGLAFGTASVIAYMKNATAQSMAFNRELYNIKSIAGELDLGKVRNELLALDSRLGYAADNAGAFYFAYSSGVRGSEKELAAFTGEVGKLSQAIVSGQIPAMDAVTSMMNAYGLKASQVSEVTDAFFQTVKQGKTTGSALANSIGAIAGVAANAGVSINDLMNAVATLTTTMPTERAITSLSGMITAFIKPTDAAKVAAAKYGIELNAAALKAKGFSGMLAEMNQKVGTNTEAIAEIVPSIEGMRAAVALAGGQYKMFADNIEIFAGKGGSAAKAFEAQAGNLDKQIANIPVTLNKINTEVGETVKNVLTLNGTLTPLIASFNSMDAGTIRTAASITAAVGGYLLLKGAIGTINTISTIRQALMQKTITKTVQETTTNTANTASIAAQTAAVNGLAAAKARLNAVSLGRVSDLASGAQNFSRHTLEERQNIQARWDARLAKRQNANYTNIIAKDMAVGASKLSNPSAASLEKILAASNAGFKELTITADRMGKSSWALIGNMKQVNTSFVQTGSLITRSPILRVGSMLARQATSLGTWQKGIAGVTSALTGGAAGIAGFATALGGIGLAVTTAIQGFKFGGDLRQKFDVWMGWEEGEEAAIQRGEDADKKLARLKEERLKKQQKINKETVKKAERSTDQKELDKSLSDFYYSQMTMPQKIYRDTMRLATVDKEYSAEAAKGGNTNLKKLNELFKEKTTLYSRLKENEESMKEFQISLNATYDSQAIESANSAQRLQILLKQRRDANARLNQAEIDNLKEQKPEQYLKTVQNAIAANKKVKEEQKRLEDLQHSVMSLQMYGAESVGDQKAMLQKRFNALNGKFSTATTDQERLNYLNQMKETNQQLAGMAKNSQDFAKGVITAYNAVEAGSMEAARLESKRYERTPADEYAQKTVDNTKSIKEKSAAMATYLKGIESQVKAITPIRVV